MSRVTRFVIPWQVSLSPDLRHELTGVERHPSMCGRYFVDIGRVLLKGDFAFTSDYRQLCRISKHDSVVYTAPKGQPGPLNP